MVWWTFTVSVCMHALPCFRYWDNAGGWCHCIYKTFFRQSVGYIVCMFSVIIVCILNNIRLAIWAAGKKIGGDQKPFWMCDLVISVFFFAASPYARAHTHKLKHKRKGKNYICVTCLCIVCVEYNVSYTHAHRIRHATCTYAFSSLTFFLIVIILRFFSLSPKKREKYA